MTITSPTRSKTLKIPPSSEFFNRTLADLQSTPALRVQWNDMNAVHTERWCRKRETRLSASHWSLRHLGVEVADCRFVRIAGPKIDVVNAMFYPCFPTQSPIFAAEIISFGGRARIAFIDLQLPTATAQSDSTVQRLTRLRDQASGLTTPAPEWATCHSSGAYYYHRGDGSRDLHDTLQTIYFGYLAEWIRSLQEQSTKNAVPQREALENLNLYKEHHVAHTPGSQFLGNVFGQSWTEDFLMNFLYKPTFIDN